MDAEERAKLKARGYKVTDYAEFLGLSPEEQAIIEMRLALAQNLKEQRLSQGIAQSVVAAKVKTTQKRISLMESADKSISLDKLFAANIAMGTPPAVLLQRVSAGLSDSYTDYQPKAKSTGRFRIVKSVRKKQLV